MALMLYAVLDIYCLPLSSLCKTTLRHWNHINVWRVSCGGVSNMLLVLSITVYFHYNIRGCVWLTGPFQYRLLKGYIYCSAHVIVIIKSEVSTFTIVIIFFRVCHIIFCHLLRMRSGKAGNLFSLLLCRLWWVQIVGYVLACRSYPFVCTLHHLIIIIV